MTRDEHQMLITMEEAVEVALSLAQRVSKALRFGMEQIQQDADDAPEQNPDRLTNRERIRHEYSQLAAMMEAIGVGSPIATVMDAKIKKVERYLKRSATCGTLAAAPAPQTAPTTQTQSWAVSVERNGENIVTIADRCLGGRDLDAEDERVIRMAAEHLRAFIGEPQTAPTTEEK